MSLGPSCRHPVFAPSAARDQFYALSVYGLAEIALSRTVRDSKRRYQVPWALLRADNLGSRGRPALSHEVHEGCGAVLTLLLHGRRVVLGRAHVLKPDWPIFLAAVIQSDHAVVRLFPFTAFQESQRHCVVVRLAVALHRYVGVSASGNVSSAGASMPGALAR